MKKREATFGIEFRHWLKANPMTSSAFELKQTTTNSIAFSCLKEHQINALLAVKNRQLLWKLPDDSRGIKCFDYFYFNKANAYVVIKYPKFFCIIDVNVFVRKSLRSKDKSLTSTEAKRMAKLVV